MKRLRSPKYHQAIYGLVRVELLLAGLLLPCESSKTQSDQEIAVNFNALALLIRQSIRLYVVTPVGTWDDALITKLPKYSISEAPPSSPHRDRLHCLETFRLHELCIHHRHWLPPLITLIHQSKRRHSL